MNTTMILAEILIVGIQAAVWVVLFIIAFCGPGWIQEIRNAIKGIELLSSFTILSFLYTLGLFVDSFAYAIFSFLRPQRLKLNFLKHKYKKLEDDTRIAALCKEGRAFTYFEYIRSRIRILRGTTINLFAIAVALVFSSGELFNTSTSIFPVIFFVFLCLILSIFSVIAVGQMQRAYDRRMYQVKLIYSKERSGAELDADTVLSGKKSNDENANSDMGASS
jgi:hypothetical protein